MADKTLVIKISADISEFNTALGQMDKAIQSQLGNLLNVSRDIGFALTGIGTAIIGGLGLSVKAFSEAQASSLQLDAALKSTGNSAVLTRQQLDELATSLSRVTAFDDDAITAAEALLIPYKDISANIFPQVIEASANLATALGIDLTDAVQQVGRALNDPAHGLRALKFLSDDQKELIKNLAASGEKMQAQTVILNALADAYGGRARKEAEGFTGQMKQLGVESHNLMEAIGQSLLPTVSSFINAAKLAAIQVTAWAKAHPELVSQISMLALGIGGVSLVLGPLLIALPTLVSSFAILSTAASASVAAMGGLTLALGAALPAIAAVGIAITGVTAAFLGWRESVGNWQQGNLILAQNTETLNSKLKELGAGVERGKDSWESYTDRVRVAAAANLQNLQNLEASKKAVDNVNTGVKSHILTLDEQIIKQRAVVEALKNTVGKDEELTREYAKLIALEKQAADQRNKLLADQPHLIENEVKLVEAKKDHAFIIETLVKNQKELLPMLSKEATDRLLIVDALDTQKRSLDLVSDATHLGADELQTLDEAWKTLGDSSTASLSRQVEASYQAYQRIANDATSTLADIQRAWDDYQKKASEVDDKIENNAKTTSKEVRSAWMQQVSTIVTDFGKGIADIIFQTGTFKDKMIALFKNIGQSIVRFLVEEGIKKIIHAFIGGGSGGSGGSDSLSGAAEAAGEKITGVFSQVKTSVGGIIDSIIGGLGKLGGAIGNFFSGIGGVIAGGVGGALGLGGLLGGGIGGKISGGIAGIAGAELLSNVAASVSGGTGILKGITTFAGILGPIGLALIGASIAIGPLISLLTKRGREKIADTKAVEPFWKDVWGIQDQYVRSSPTGDPASEQLTRDAILTAGVTGWNELVKSFKLKSSADSQRPYMYDWIKSIDTVFGQREATYPGATPNMTLPVQVMAAGGLVTRPTFALLGEAGPELVTPLNRGGRGSSAVQQTIIFQNVNDLGAQRQMLDRVNRHLVRQLA